MQFAFHAIVIFEGANSLESKKNVRVFAIL